MVNVVAVQIFNGVRWDAIGAMTCINVLHQQSKSLASLILDMIGQLQSQRLQSNAALSTS